MDIFIQKQHLKSASLELKKKFIDILELKPFFHSKDISFKTVKKEELDEEARTFIKKFPFIHNSDFLLKNVTVEKGDLVCIYRDYQLNVSPYFYYRIVV